MRIHLSVLILALAATLAQAQAPDDALQRGQVKAGAAYRELQNAEFARKQAEDEYRQADASHKAAQTKFDAAKAREAAARKTYEAAVEAVDKIPPPAGKNK